MTDPGLRDYLFNEAERTLKALLDAKQITPEAYETIHSTLRSVLGTMMPTVQLGHRARSVSLRLLAVLNKCRHLQI